MQRDQGQEVGQPGERADIVRVHPRPAGQHDAERPAPLHFIRAGDAVERGAMGAWLGSRLNSCWSSLLVSIPGAPPASKRCTIYRMSRNGGAVDTALSGIRRGVTPVYYVVP